MNKLSISLDKHYAYDSKLVKIPALGLTEAQANYLEGIKDALNSVQINKEGVDEVVYNKMVARIVRQYFRELSNFLDENAE